MGQYSYDQTGALFNYFMLTILLVMLIPYTLSLLFGKPKPLSRKLIGIVGWVLFALVMYRSMTMTLVEETLWDPYQILDVPTGADGKMIKKAFKKLSLKFHPDKVKQAEKEQAEKMFVEISKAYKVLTDDEARNVFDEFGHPDGKQAFKLGVALPSWLVEEGNANLVLLVYGLLFGVGLPVMVARWWNHAKEVSKNEVLNTTMGQFYRDLKDDVNGKKILELISRAEEFQKIITTKATKSDWDEFETAVKAQMSSKTSEALEKSKKIASNDIHSLISQRVILLLNAHMLRVTPTNSIIVKQLEETILMTAPLLTGLLQISVSRNWMNASGTVLTVMQHIVQAVHFKQGPLSQLPHLDADLLKHFNTKKRQIKDIDEFIKLPIEEQESLLKNLSPTNIKEVIAASLKYPQCHIINWEYKVLGEPAVIPGAIVTLSIKLGSYYGNPGDILSDPEILDADQEVKPNWFENENDKERNVYAPYYPALKKPVWWISLANSSISRLICMGKQVGLDSDKVVRLTFQAPPNPGRWTFQISVKSDSYLGVDCFVDAELVVVEASAASLFVPDDDISEPEEPIGTQSAPAKKEKEDRGQYDDSTDSDSEFLARKPNLDGEELE